MTSAAASKVQQLIQLWIGVVPRAGGLKYAWHDFPKEFKVADCIYFDWLREGARETGRSVRGLAGLVAWLPFAPSLPRE